MPDSTGTDPHPVTPLGETSSVFDYAPWAVTELSKDAHVVRYANSAFCRLIGKTPDEVVGRSFDQLIPAQESCLPLLDRVYRTGLAESYVTPELPPATPAPLLFSYSLWPVKADGRTAGVIVQVNETGQLHETRQAVSQALLIGALRQDRLLEAARSANVRLQTELAERRQREIDAKMLANEVAHRVKNNLQIAAALVSAEGKKTPPPWNQGYRATHDRIMAIAKLYDLMSQSTRGGTIDLRAYVAEIAKTLSASVLGGASGIRIDVEAEAVQLDAGLAVPFGLLVNELSTNAIKHAFPGGTGVVSISVRSIGKEVELSVADNGTGMSAEALADKPGKHGFDYAAIFVRQLGGTLVRSTAPGTGTTCVIHFPLVQGPAASGE